MRLFLKVLGGKFEPGATAGEERKVSVGRRTGLLTVQERVRVAGLTLLFEGLACQAGP